MTTVYTSQLAASDPKAVGTHVLIVGVGEYPCLLGGNGQLLDNPMSLKQLSSPPVSAARLATWFLGRQGPSPAVTGFHNPGAPLATVEMLLSPSQAYTRPDGTQVPVEVATRANIAQSFTRWQERAAANDANVAVLYFCGHGVMGANDYVLPSDFGAVNRNNPWADAIDITETARAVRRLASGPLYFLIDACRQAARDALSPGANPPALAYVDFKKPVCGFTRLILWATGEGETAFGAAGEASRFCTALTEALSGYEAEEVPGGQSWVITGDLLQRSVSAILEAANASLDADKRQYVERQLIGSQPFQFVTERPRQVAGAIPSSWSVGPEVRQMLEAWGVGDALPAKVLEVLAEKMEAKNLQVAELQKEVNDWTQLYGGIKQRLAAQPDSEFIRQVQGLLQAGKLEEAGAALDQLIAVSEALIAADQRRVASDQERLASNYLSRGRIFRLQFKPLEALPFYKKAFDLRPSNPRYAMQYGSLLLEQRDYDRAESVCIKALPQLREIVVSKPPRMRALLARLLNILGIIYSETERPADAEGAYQEALSIYHLFSKRHRMSAVLAKEAATLNNLGSLYLDTSRPDQADGAFHDALRIYRNLADDVSPIYLADVAMMHNNLGALFADAKPRRPSEASQSFEEALKVYRTLADDNQIAYLPDVAMTLNNLGNFRAQTRHFTEAEAAFQEALAIYRTLATSNPAAHLPNLAVTLENLGAFYKIRGRLQEAERAYGKALAKRRELAAASPRAYLPSLVETLEALGNLCSKSQRLAEAKGFREEARKIRKQLPAVAEPRD